MDGGKIEFATEITGINAVTKHIEELILKSDHWKGSFRTFRKGRKPTDRESITTNIGANYRRDRRLTAIGSEAKVV